MAAHVAATAASVQRRCVTTRGQYNPIHDFSVSFGEYEVEANGASQDTRKGGKAAPLRYAKNEAEFEKLVTNPGPLRVGYSADYLNWLYMAYKNKVEYKKRQQQASRESGELTGGAGSSEKEAGMGRFLRPDSSHRRRAGEAKRAANQEKISRLIRRQGLYDLVERQPQFPFVDLANATRFHYVQLFKDLVLHYYNSNYFSLHNAAGGGDGSVASAGADFSFSQELWDKALLYRAIIEERRNSYPDKTFDDVFTAVEGTNLVPLSTLKADAGENAATATAVPLADRCPTEEQYLYFRYLVKKYFVENAVEGHVVLKAHRQPNAPELLFCSPPPKDDTEVFASLSTSSAQQQQQQQQQQQDGEKKGGPSADTLRRIVHKKPGQYPPIEALWRCEENLPLLKILVFGELNLFVSENPFTKFPNALPFLTRPYASAATADSHASGPSGGGGYRQQQHRSDVLSLANIIAERRGTALVSFPRNVSNLIDSRNTDIRRQQQRFHREDILAFSKVLGQHSSVSGGGGGGKHSSTLSGALGGGGGEGSAATPEDENAFFYGAFSDFSYYNPRTTRAEKRDYLTRRSIAALKEVRAAEDDIYRAVGIEEAESNQQFCRNVEDLTTLPVHLPTLPHYVAIIKKDPHVSYLLHVHAPVSSDLANGTQSKGGNGELERLIFQLARALANTAMNYHKQAVRRVNRQKANVAAALLDSYVDRAVAEAKQALVSSSASAAGGSDDQLRLLHSLGPYRPFENRALDESGYFTDARTDDYRRWMAAPAPQQ